jgi:hypothetical protein
MDAFEIIVGQCLEEKGYWVRHSVKVELTKEEKRNRFTYDAKSRD